MFAKVLVLILLFLSVSLHAQNSSLRNIRQNAEENLNKHVSAAETFQLSGDLENAAVENNQIVAITLERLGNLAFAEGQYKSAAGMFAEAVNTSDSAETRTSLALADLRLNETDEALIQARQAVNLDPKNFRAQQTLGKILYARDDFAAALPALERAIVLEPDFDTAYALGISYLQLKQLDRAKLLFEEMQNALKNSAGLHVLFGQAFEETNYPAEAERQFKQAIAADPKVSGAHFYLGYLILQHGGSERLGEAGKEFETELQLDPKNAYTNFFAGVVASSENEHAKAIRFLQEAVRLNPAIAPAYLFLGQSQAELGDAANAEKNLRRSIELTGNASDNSFQIRRAHFLLGRLLNKSGRKAEGEKELATARELQGQLVESARDEIRKTLGQVVSATKSDAPEKISTTKSATAAQTFSPTEKAKIQTIKNQLAAILAQAYHNLGVIAAAQQNPDEALAKFAAAAKWKPDFPGLDRNWGIVAFRGNQFDRAIAPLSRHVKAHADDALARRMLGVSYYLTRNYKQAVETLKPVETTVANDPELAYFYGIALIELERQPEAAKLFARLAEQNPKTAQARFYAGQGFTFVGDYERAVREFRAAAALDSTVSQAHYSAGQALIRLNKLDEAEKEFRQELKADSSSAAAKYSIAYTLLERKIKIDEALNLLREAIAARPDYADARYQLGKALIEKGAVKEAVEQLESAAASEPKKDYIRYQLSIAYRRDGRAADAERELKNYRELKAANRSEKPSGMGAKTDAP